MVDNFRFELVSPERLLLSLEATSVLVPGSEGDFVVYSQHAPLMTNIRPGVIVVNEAESDVEHEIYIQGGFADVSADGLTILAEEAIFIRDLSAEDIERRLSNAREDAEDAENDEDRRTAQEAIRRLSTLRDALR